MSVTPDRARQRGALRQLRVHIASSGRDIAHKSDKRLALTSETALSLVTERGRTTMSTLISDRSVLVSADEIEQARQVSASIDWEAAASPFDVVTEHDRHIRVPAELAGVVRAVLSAMARGASVTVAAMPAEITTTVAAKELGVSRPTLMKMIKNSEIPAHKVGSHTRLKTDDVHAVLRQRRNEQRRAFNDLRDFEESLGLDDN